MFRSAPIIFPICGFWGRGVGVGVRVYVCVGHGVGVDRVTKVFIVIRLNSPLCRVSYYKLQDGGHFAEDAVERISTAAAADGGGVCPEAVENDQHGGHGTTQGADHWRTGPAGKRTG